MDSWEPPVHGIDPPRRCWQGPPWSLSPSVASKSALERVTNEVRYLSDPSPTDGIFVSRSPHRLDDTAHGGTSCARWAAFHHSLAVTRSTTRHRGPYDSEGYHGKHTPWVSPIPRQPPAASHFSTKTSNKAAAAHVASTVIYYRVMTPPPLALLNPNEKARVDTFFSPSADRLSQT